jgi:hypothetical protein
MHSPREYLRERTIRDFAVGACLLTDLISFIGLGRVTKQLFSRRERCGSFRTGALLRLLW